MGATNALVLTYALYLDPFWFCSVELPRPYVCVCVCVFVCECVIWMLGFWKGLRAVSSLVCYRNCLPCCIVVFCYIVQPVSNYNKPYNRYICTCNSIKYRTYICSFPQIQSRKSCAVPCSSPTERFGFLFRRYWV